MSFREKVRGGFRFGMATIIFFGFLGILFKILGYEETEQIPPDMPFWMFAIAAIIVAPFLEEGLFRWLPLRLTRLLTKNALAFWIVALGSSALWAYGHPGKTAEVFILFIPVGMLLSFAFSKYGYGVCVIAHMTNNTFATLVLYLLQYFAGNA